MGSEQVRCDITASLCRNNTYRDGVHDEMWTEFVERIQMLASIPKYNELNINIRARSPQDDV